MTALTLGSYPYVEDYLDVLLRHGRKPVRWVTDDDISLSISASLRPQDKVILHLGSAYGLRRGEIATLKVDDLHRDHMIVHGKVDIMRAVGHESYDTTADYIRTDGKKAEKVMVMRNSKNNHYISDKAF